jgi:anti-anti-sigma regulatory factor
LDGCGGIRLGWVPGLESRLEQLCAEEQPVRLDLSRLGFMDSTGIHLGISAFNHAPADGWRFEVDPDVSRPVEQLFRLTDVERITAATG